MTFLLLYLEIIRFEIALIVFIFLKEISCFGKDGDGDTGDHWKVICNGDYWTDDDTVQFKHQDTGKFLGTSGNQYGRPIAGQKEVVGLGSGSSYNSYWKTAEGIYVRKKDDESL
jgi:hypothetical protein